MVARRRAPTRGGSTRRCRAPPRRSRARAPSRASRRRRRGRTARAGSPAGRQRQRAQAEAAVLGIEVGGAARDGRGDVRGQRRHLGERRPEQSGERLQRAPGGSGMPPGQEPQTAPPAAAEKRTSGTPSARAGGAGAEPGGEAGQPVQLQLEREQQRIEGDVARRRARSRRARRAAGRARRTRAATGRPRRTSSAAPRRRRRRCAPARAARAPRGASRACRRRETVCSSPRPSCSTSATWLNGSSRAPTRERVRRTPLATAPTRPREGV